MEMNWDELRLNERHTATPLFRDACTQRMNGDEWRWTEMNGDELRWNEMSHDTLPHPSSEKPACSGWMEINRDEINRDELRWRWTEIKWTAHRHTPLQRSLHAADKLRGMEMNRWDKLRWNEINNGWTEMNKDEMNRDECLTASTKTPIITTNQIDR